MNLTSCISVVLKLIAIAAIASCANPVSPSGGPKDTKAPEVISCEPANYSIGFQEKNFRINFNEFVNLTNPVTEITISPPLKEFPDFRVRGKSIVVQFGDTLATNTTYRFSFGKSITDITENNPLTNFTYVVSTGTYIDSLSLQGKITGAFDLQPQKDFLALLYLNNNDSLPLDSLPFHVKPYYVTRADEEGFFRFDNLMQDSMLLIALRDQNGNGFFDQPSEMVGFLDSLVVPVFLPKPKADTTTASDSIPTDTISRSDTGHIKMPMYYLTAFEQTDSIQRVIKTSIPFEGCFRIILRFPAKDPQVTQYIQDSLQSGFIVEPNSARDTLTLFFPGLLPDSLFAVLSDMDSLIDTLRVSLKPLGKKKKQEKDEKATYLQITSNAKTGALNQFAGPLILESAFPLKNWDLSGLRLISEPDTFSPGGVPADSTHRKFIIPHKWSEGKNYRLFIPDSALIALNQLANDTLRQDFKTRQAKEFGSLILNLEEIPGQMIIQILGDKESVITERYLSSPGKIRIDYLKPASYKIKAILDRNGNKKWDSGDLRKRIQPEKVYYLPKTLELRANWEVEENWTIR